MNMKFLFLAIFTCTLTTFLSSEENEWKCRYGNLLNIGPEIYHIDRTREGGVKQNGTIYGVRAGWNFIKRYNFYWGVDGLWARGQLEGRTDGVKIKSTYTDKNIESRMGYTLQCKNWRGASFTPYFGVGRFWETNKFSHPKDLQVELENIFSYIPFGFLSQIFITSDLSIGANLKVRWIWQGKQEVRNDPEHDHLSLNYEEKFQYRAEIPVTYFFCWKCQRFAMSAIPFYEYRQYGHRANFPFDFLETKLKLYGINFQMIYLF